MRKKIAIFFRINSVHEKNENGKITVNNCFKKIAMLLMLIVIIKALSYDLEEKTIYLLGIVSIIASCASYGQIIADRKSNGVYNYLLGVGQTYNAIVLIELIELYIRNIRNYIFLAVSNIILWFAISKSFSAAFIINYLLLIIIISPIFSLMIIQTSLININASYLMSFSILLIIIILILMPLIKGILIIFCVASIIILVFFLLRIIGVN